MVHRRLVRQRVAVVADKAGVAIGILGYPIADLNFWVDFKLRVLEIRIVLGGVV